jgi:cyclopropane-fatty-acyl-phospholipid synthase
MAAGAAAVTVAPLLEGLCGDRLPVRFEFWDGSAIGPPDGPGTIIVRSPDAISRMLWAPGELGIGRAYVAGDHSTDGDTLRLLAALHDAARPDLRAGARPALLALRAALQLGVLGRPRPGRRRRPPPAADDIRKAATRR